MHGSEERALLWAVIECAVMDAQGKVFGEYDPELVSKRAKIWLFRWKDSDISIPFTFPWCCSFLDLCPDTTRRRISKLLKTGGVGEKEHTMRQWNMTAFFKDLSSSTDSEVYYL